MSTTESRAIPDYEFNRVTTLTDSMGRLISQSAAANNADVTKAVNDLVLELAKYASELLAVPKAEEPVVEPPVTEPELTPSE